MLLPRKREAGKLGVLVILLVKNAGVHILAPKPVPKNAAPAKMAIAVFRSCARYMSVTMPPTIMEKVATQNC